MATPAFAPAFAPTPAGAFIVTPSDMHVLRELIALTGFLKARFEFVETQLKLAGRPVKGIKTLKSDILTLHGANNTEKSRQEIGKSLREIQNQRRFVYEEYLKGSWVSGVKGDLIKMSDAIEEFISSFKL